MGFETASCPLPGRHVGKSKHSWTPKSCTEWSFMHNVIGPISWSIELVVGGRGACYHTRII